ncbi:MAG: cupin [Desulfobacteraceae bacterium IS3]|nr:MAG: cupin [Desulfobacteraceae bacterium IS3]HAO19718.1 cupin [Desulfobacteraceae bacterium]
MKRIEVFKENGFSDKGMKKLLIQDSPYFRVLKFNFMPGQELPIHSHDVEGSGEFLGKDGAVLPANQGDVLISAISEPHGIRAKTNMRVLVTIAPLIRELL